MYLCLYKSTGYLFSPAIVGQPTSVDTIVPPFTIWRDSGSVSSTSSTLSMAPTDAFIVTQIETATDVAPLPAPSLTLKIQKEFSYVPKLKPPTINAVYFCSNLALCLCSSFSRSSALASILVHKWWQQTKTSPSAFEIVFFFVKILCHHGQHSNNHANL